MINEGGDREREKRLMVNNDFYSFDEQEIDKNKNHNLTVKEIALKQIVKV